MASKRELAAKWAGRTGLLALGRWRRRASLTIVCHHRIAEPEAGDFVGYAPNVSATPAAFSAQLDFLARHYQVVGLAQVRAALMGGAALPPRPLLITFDDGYRDNLTQAAPLLARKGLPAVIFLLTSRMSAPTALPWWDALAEAFKQTPCREADLPLLGHTAWEAGAGAQAICESLLRGLKRLPESDKQAALAQIFSALAVNPTSSAPLFMTWDEVRTLATQGIDCQPHTHSHPILSRVSLEVARQELAQSKAEIEAQLGTPAYAFAYPNGGVDDYRPEHLPLLADLGYELAFTLRGGAVRLVALGASRYELTRIFLSHKDSPSLFALKLAWA
jgi:peptidoglycan/xylan/chitin deacetylase (PgdA/CDA1 family)